MKKTLAINLGSKKANGYHQERLKD